MGTTVDVQLNPARSGWPELREMALAAEAAGYGALWVYDHLAGTSIFGHTMLETFSLLGALAVSTTTIELGTLVVNVNNRTPGLLAVAAASIVAISGRRLHLGLGAGTSPTSRWASEMHAVGQPIIPTLADRHAHLGVVLDVLERVYDPDRPPELATFPLPVPRPSVLVGVNSVDLATLAGRGPMGSTSSGPAGDETSCSPRPPRPGVIAPASC